MFKKALKENQARLDKSLRARPSLIQRFVIQVKSEEGKKSALATVVANVFGNDLSNLKGVFTAEEADLVEAIKASKFSEENGNDI